MDDTGVPLIGSGNCVFGMHFITAVIVKGHVEATGILTTADKTKIRVGLFPHEKEVYYRL
jgi:hypothetical protein